MLNTETHWNPIRASAGRRVVAAESHWSLPAKWNAAAEREGVRRRVFCASLSDVFEEWGGQCTMTDGRAAILQRSTGQFIGCNLRGGSDAVRLDDVRRRVFETFDATPWLDWIVPTKWPQNVRRMWPEVYSKGSYTPAYVVGGEIVGPDYTPEYHRPNVWLLANVRDQNTADAMIPALLECRDLVPVLGVSCELVGPVYLRRWFGPQSEGEWLNVVECGHSRLRYGINWMRVGGESGPKARPCRVEWIKAIRDQCKAAGVPCFVSQLGSNIITRNDQVEDEFNGLNTGWPDPHVEYHIHGFREDYQGADCRIRLRDKSGSDPAEWPADLRVREYPEVRQ